MPPLLEYVKNKPNDGRGFHALGLACKCLGRVNDAMDALNRAVRLDPKGADIHYDLGLTLAQAARSAEAIQELKAAAQFDPTNPQPHQQLALLLQKTGNKEGALAESAKVRILRTREGSQAAAGRFNAEANQFLLAGNASAAVKSYRHALELNPTDAKLRYKLRMGASGTELALSGSFSRTTS